MENERKNILRSSMLMLAAAFAGAIVANSVKGLSFLFSTVIIYFFTRLFSAVGILRTLFQKGKLSVQKEHFLMIVLTVIFYNLSMYFYFFSLKKISIVDASLLFNSAPLFVPFFAYFLMKERITHRIWFGIIVSFVGVILVLQPGSGLFKYQALWALVSGVSMAASQAFNRKVAQQVPSKTIVVYLVLLSIVISFVPLFFINWEATLSAWLHHQPLLWLSILILAGVMSWIYQLARTQAVAKVKVGQIMPLSYTGVVFAGLLGWVFFHEIPDTLSLIGAVLVVSGTLCCIKPDSRSKSNSA